MTAAVTGQQSLAARAITRRSMLAGTAVLAPLGVLSAAPSSGLPPSAAAAWDSACLRFHAARSAHLTFLREVLDPLCRAARGQGQHLTAQIFQLESQGNALCSARHDALAALVSAPAPDLCALRLKFRLAYHEVLQAEDHRGLIRAVLLDLERLAA